MNDISCLFAVFEQVPFSYSIFRQEYVDGFKGLIFRQYLSYSPLSSINPRIVPKASEAFNARFST